MKMIKNKIIAIGVLIAITMCSCLFCIFTKKDVFTVYAMEQANNENIALTNGDKKSDSVVFIEGEYVGTSYVTSGTRSDLTEAKYIPNANYFLINPKHRDNDGSDNELGTCPTVAMQLLLGYHNYYSDRRILKSSYLASDYGNVYFDPFFNRSRESKQGCGIIGTEDTVYEEIFNRTAIADVPVIGQIIPSVVDGTKKFINQCAEEVSDEISINWGNFSASAVREDINNGKPVAVGINLLLEANLHVVVAYGYAKIGGVDGFLVHYGWGDDGTMVWIPEGILGFQIRMSVNHEHNFVDTQTNLYSSARVLQCSECGCKKVDKLYDIEDDTISAVRYPILDELVVNRSFNYYNVYTAEFETLGVSSIGNNAFADQTQVTAITLPNSLTSFGLNAFSGCTNLTSINIPYNVTSIGMQAFSGCANLADIYIPSDVTFIGAGVFAGCNNLNLAVSTGNSEYSAQGNILYNKTMTKIISSGNTAANITIPDTVTEVGESAFKDNLKLQRVDIYGTPTIGALAFHKCTNLSKVYFYSYVVPEIGSGAFTDDDFILYVPHSKQGAYNSIFYGYTVNIDSIPITISFYDDGVVASTLNTYYGAYITGIENPSKVGHDFGGYYDNVDYTGTVYQNGGIWDTTTDMAVYPKWTPKTYLIHFSGEGSENLEDKTVTYGEPIGTMPTVTIIGKTFYGWKNQYNEYFTSDMIWLKLSNQTVESDLRANQYTVTYDGNGGTVSAESMSVFYGSVIESFATAFLDGYTFAGWNTSADGSGQTFTAPYAYEIDEDVTLYAQYTANIYNVSFDKQGGSGGSDGVSVAYDDEMPQGNAVIAPAKVGYTFKGYYRYPNGLGKQYYNADMTSNVVWDLSDDAYLFAHWEAVEYTVTFDKQGGSGGSNSVVAKYGEAMPQGNAVIAPAKVGYTFKGYYRNKNGTGTQYYNAEMKSCNAWNIAENTVIYAFWTPNQYTVLLERNDGTGSVDQITVTYMEDMPAAPLPQYVGYDFRGYYYTSPNGTKIQYYNADMSSCRKWDIADNATLRADKKGKEYEVILNRQGGSGGTTKITVTYGDDMPSAIAPSRTDYNFKGYFSEPNGIGKKYYESNMDSLIKWDEPSGGTLYAHWELKTYTITLILYGNLKDSINVYYGDEIQATYAPARSHYEFVGYYSQPNGVGDCYVKGVLKYEYEIYHIIPESTGKKWYSHGNGTLYAHWKLFETDYSYQVSVEGEADLANRTMHIVSGANTVLNAPSIDGYTFKEWEVNRTTQANGSSYVFELHRSYTSGKIAIYYFNGGPAKYSDGYLCAVYTKDPSCVAAGTMITLADGRQVPVESLTGSERLLVWNLKTGSFDSAPILFIDHDALANYKIINLRFSDGTVVKVIDEHAFWDFDLNKYVFLRKDAAQYIGHWFNKQTTDEGGNLTWTRVQLTNVTLTEEYTTAWSPVTYGHLCIYVNGMLSMPGATEGFVNIFDVDGETMKIDEAQYLADVATYGLFTYEEFAEIYDVPEAIFEAVGGENLKVSIGKGFIDYETLGVLIERYSEFFE